MAKHRNLSIFIPHLGCPHQCSFCDQHTISGAGHAPAPEEVATLCRETLARTTHPDQMEVAFFGGSFTAIPSAYRRTLLECVQPFLGDGKFTGIRISTRPDCITIPILKELYAAGVTAIELGAQSMSDRVLLLNRRGHTVQDVVNACRMIRQFPFELGLQMMIGLYGSTMQTEYATLQAMLTCRPDTIRLYPVVVLEGTVLADMYDAGQYSLYDMEQVLDFCADARCQFARAGIRVIRCGLHDSSDVARRAVAGFYHPAFGELVEGRIYRRAMEWYLKRQKRLPDTLLVQTAPGTCSQVIGQKKCNVRHFAQRQIAVSVRESDALQPGQISIEEEVYDVFKIIGTTGV